MPSKPKKPCSQPGCAALTHERFCDAHKREDRAVHDAARADKPWRKWYKSGRWLALRAVRLQAEPLCRYCAADGLTVAGNVVDHIVPHRGDVGLFWDFANTQTLCKPCHDGRKQAEERRGASARRGGGVRGWGVSNRYAPLVPGPVASPIFCAREKNAETFF